MSYRETMIKVLKEKWVSNNYACKKLNSAEGGRTIRYIRKYPPIGWKVIEQWVENCDNEIKRRYKIFRLVEEN